MAVIAAMTAQNTLGVSAAAEVAPEFVAQQLDAVFTDIPPDAVKTGMLLTSAVIETVAETLKRYGVRNLVVDPVMISTSGACLMKPDAITAFREALLPLASLVTPNLEEAGVLAGKAPRTLSEMERAAVRVHELSGSSVLIKGGHLEGEQATDVLFNGKDFQHFRQPRVDTRHTHGTGCVLSASIAVYLALGESMAKAVMLGKDFVTKAIRNSLQIGSGIGPCDPLSLGGEDASTN
jgi:hydroxymethylpyrimidine/phosphomethylpyrimidine kinase